MESVKERISRHLLMDDRFEAIALVEDEIDNIVEQDTRLQCGIIKDTLNNRKVCVDVMECLPYNELKYQMFSHIENNDMLRPSTYAWVLYEKAQNRDKEKMGYCIHTLCNYIKNMNN